MPLTRSDDEAKTLNEEADPVMMRFGEKAFQAEGVASAKALWWEGA